jgi:hypothetical protein
MPKRRGKYTKLPLNYQMAIICTKLSKIYSKWPQNIPNISILRPFQFHPNWYFWFENIPYGKHRFLLLKRVDNVMQTIIESCFLKWTLINIHPAVSARRQSSKCWMDNLRWKAFFSFDNTINSFAYKPSLKIAECSLAMETVTELEDRGFDSDRCARFSGFIHCNVVVQTVHIHIAVV